MIKKEDIDKIFEAALIEEVVGDYVTLKKRGVNLIGLCPFHDEKTPSFYVSPIKGICKCFGCGKGGNAVNFLMEKEAMTYPDALRYLAKKYNIDIEEEQQTPEQIVLQGERESLYVASSYAQKHFSENLYNTDEGKSVGLGYFKERGFREDIIQKFQLGYSINSRNVFTDIAIATGYKVEYLVKSGLTIEFKNEKEGEEQLENTEIKQESRYIDRFSGRVMFPIHNISGRVIGFGGRTLRTDTKKIAKYINSPETDIYHKSNVLYGLYFSKSAIHKEDNCLLVEGYTDVISMHQAGIENVVASSGTALTIEQIKLIRRITNNITILYDGDSAGIKASFRGIDLILEEGMNVKVLLFPDGEDPDSYSKRVTSGELKSFIKNNSKSFIEFQTNVLINDAGQDPIKRAEVIVEIANTLSILHSLQSEQFITRCSQMLNIDEQSLINLVNKKRHERRDRKKIEPSKEKQIFQEEELEKFSTQELSSIVNSAEYQERDIIRLMLNFGNTKITVDSEDGEGKPTEIQITTAELLIHELQQDNIILENLLYNSIFNEFVTHFNHHHTVLDQKHFINHENIAVCSLTVDLLSSPYNLSNWEQHDIYVIREEDILKRSIYNAIYAIKSIKIDIMKNDLRKKIKETTSHDDIVVLVTILKQIEEARVLINKPLGRIITK